MVKKLILETNVYFVSLQIAHFFILLSFEHTDMNVFQRVIVFGSVSSSRCGTERYVGGTDIKQCSDTG